MSRLSRPRITLTSLAGIAVVAALAVPPAAADPGGSAAVTAGAHSVRGAPVGSTAHERSAAEGAPDGKELMARQYFDSRREGRAGDVLERRAASTVAEPPSAVVRLKRTLGTQG